MTDTASRRVEGEWAHFTPHLPDVIDDPYPAFRWLRQNAPAFYVDSEDIWVLSRYDDVVAAARDPQTFSQTESVGYSRHRGKGLALTALDPPDHTELRRLTAPIFSPRAVATHRADAVALLDELLDDAIDAPGPVNFAEAVANPYLSRLVGGMMGLPEADLPQIKAGATAGSLAMAGDFSDDVMAAVQEFGRYFVGFVSERADALARGECPPGDLTNKLFEPCPSGRELTFDEQVAYEVLLATGGNETTAQLLSNLLLLLEREPTILARLRAEPELRPSAVEEVLRYISPVTGLFRHTTRPVVVAGTQLPAEAKVLLMYGSANHDERHYDRPDEFVIDRYPRGFADSDHVSFTTGIHVCLGGHLARLLINVFLERMAERIDAIEIAGPVVRSPNALVRVIDDLPVVLTPRAR
jgi:cytochrome P450